MRSHRRILIHWPALLAVAALGVVVTPGAVSADGDDVPPGGDAVVVADPAPPDPVPPAGTDPDTPPATTAPTESTVPPDADETDSSPTTQLPADTEAPATTTVSNPEPDAPPTTQPPIDSGVPATTVPSGDPDAAPTAPSPLEPQGSAVTVPTAEPQTPSVAQVPTVPGIQVVSAPNAEPAPPSNSLPVAAREMPAASSGEPTATSDVSVVSTPFDELMEAFAAFPNGLVRQISFPVLGPVGFFNDWGACRDECTRLHVGTDVIGVRMQPLLAAVDGTVTRIGYTNIGTHGVDITITGADGWYYNYFHVNNDSPGTDDGAAAREWEVSPLVTVGSRVRAGQVIAYMGDSGNAEGSVPHLHFEIREPDQTPVNPYPSLVAARKRQTCSGNDPGLALLPDASLLSPTLVAVTPIGGRGRWLIDAVGGVYAEGSAALVTQIDGMHCAQTNG